MTSFLTFSASKLSVNFSLESFVKYMIDREQQKLSQSLQEITATPSRTLSTHGEGGGQRGCGAGREVHRDRIWFSCGVTKLSL